MAKSDIEIIKKMLTHCEDITTAVDRFGGYENFCNDRHYYLSVSMAMMQIGELSKHLKTEFRKEYEESIPWRTMVGMRNLFAHHYHVMDKSEIWDTVQTKIPTLIEFCEKVITMN
jgi:uncharacterized protein with HEPN domain